GLLASAGAPFRQLGLTAERVAPDVRAACVTWLVLTPLVFVTNLAAVTAYTWLVGPPAEHPLLEPFRRGPVPAGAVALLVIEAVLAAPLREELFFRGILQPYFVRHPYGGDMALALAAVIGVLTHGAGDLNVRDPVAIASALAPALFVLALLPLYY